VLDLAHGVREAVHDLQGGGLLASRRARSILRQRDPPREEGGPPPSKEADSQSRPTRSEAQPSEGRAPAQEEYVTGAGGTPPREAPDARTWPTILAAAALLTAANALAPFAIDEAVYREYAAQIAAHPGDPYGFEVFWYEAPEPAVRVTVPPVFVYWWAAGIALFGDAPLLWRLWTFPFALVFAASLYALLRRFAPGLEAPLLWMGVAAPAVLPSANLMLDVPVLALGLATIALVLHAVEDERVGPALLAGLAGALALETKYNGALFVAAAVGFAAGARRFRAALVAGLLPLAGFAAFEGFAAWRYGASPFLHALLVGTPGQDLEKPFWPWTLALLSLLGATAPALGLLALRALGARVGESALACGLVLAAFAWIPFLPAESLARARSSIPVAGAPHPELAVFVPLGVCVAAALAAASWRLARETRGAPPARARLERGLLFWIALEVAGYYLVSPFPAARRTLGMSVAFLLLGGSLLARRGSAHEAWRRARPALALGIALGALHYTAVRTDLRAREAALPLALARLNALGAKRDGEAVWFTGHWEFQLYAKRAGLLPLAPGRSRVAAGDWVVVPRGVDSQSLRTPPAALAERDAVSVVSSFPWSGVPSFFHGPVPLRAQPEFQILVQIYRALVDFVPASAAPRRAAASPSSPAPSSAAEPGSGSTAIQPRASPSGSVP
jgi:hypothetical protein